MRESSRKTSNLRTLIPSEVEGPCVYRPSIRHSSRRSALVKRLRDSKLRTAKFGQIRDCATACEIDFEIISPKRERRNSSPP
jgi:hypothetical protein